MRLQHSNPHTLEDSLFDERYRFPLLRVRTDFEVESAQDAISLSETQGQQTPFRR